MTCSRAKPPIMDRMDLGGPGSPVAGRVRWSPVKSLWWSGMTAAWLTAGVAHFSLSAVVVFIVLCAVTLCLGHSLGMHRMLIHGAFETPKWLERLLVYLGTLVGLGGPFTMMSNHDMRDWAQRSPECHPFLAHRAGIVRDFWRQLHCKLDLALPPAFRFPEVLTGDRFYCFIQATSMAQQLPLALALYAIGGWGWVAWGVCGRVSVSIFGHWIVGYFAHNKGFQDWRLEGVSTQAYNIPRLGLITFGECWHNNHHAFPGSAKLGLKPGQFDPGWLVVQALQGLGLARNVQTPESLPPRANLLAVGASA